MKPKDIDDILEYDKKKIDLVNSLAESGMTMGEIEENYPDAYKAYIQYLDDLGALVDEFEIEELTSEPDDERFPEFENYEDASPDPEWEE